MAATTTTSGGNLPPSLTSFVGRREELATIERLVADSRLVTVTGAGGIGKTRLVVEYARHAAPSYPDGAWLVDLAPLTAADLLPNVVLTTLGLNGPAGPSALDGVAGALAERELLLVLDNCEHLVESCAQLADALLHRCQGLHLLATSREVLGVAGETTWRLPAMATPHATQRMTLADLQRLESVRLFLERAETARPGFRLADESAETVTRICRQLDGIPLAIELAAARTRTLPLAVIDERLHDQLALLGATSRSGLPRQRTLQATLDWSHDLLAEDEQRLFRALAVFRGGFTLEAAEYVGSNRVGPTTVLDVLASLVDKSLVVLEDRQGRPARFRLLEPVREYALGKLSGAGELDAAATRHADYFLNLGDKLRAGLISREQVQWAMPLEDDLDNFRACFAWALSHTPQSALRLTLDLERYWFFARRGEGHDWLERSLAASPASNELRAHALYNLSVWKCFQGIYAEARRLADECLGLAGAIRSTLYEGKATMAIAFATTAEHDDGVPASTLTLLDRAEALIRSVDEPRETALVLNNHGYTRLLVGDTEVARQKLREGLAIVRKLGDVMLTMVLEGSLADAEKAAGDRTAAEAGWRRELELAGSIGSLIGASEALTGLGRLSLDDGDVKRSLTLAAAADELFRHTGSRWMGGFSADLVRDATARAERALAPGEAETARLQGTHMSLPEAVAYGLASGAPATDVPPNDATPLQQASATNTFTREGEYWAIRFEGRTVRLRDSKGLQDLARLTAAPRKEIAAVDLAFAVSQTGRPAEAGMREQQGVGVETDAGPALDAEARRQYAQRLADLEEDVQNAEVANDPERAFRARQERDFIVDELKAAVGLGGRDRRMLDPAERARKAVTARIRDSIGRIEAVHPSLGEHLRRSVRTGTFCVYDPPVPTTWGA